MEIEHIARICLTSRGTLKQQGKGTVCNRVLGKIIVNDQYVFSLIHEILCQRRTGIRCDILKRSRIGCRSCNNNRIVQCLIFL